MENRQILLEQLRGLREMVSRLDWLKDRKIKYKKRGKKAYQVSGSLFVFTFLFAINSGEFYSSIASLSSFAAGKNVDTNIFTYYTWQFTVVLAIIFILTIINRLNVKKINIDRIKPIDEEIDELSKRIKQNGIIHQEYCKKEDLDKFISYLTHGQARNLYECINCHTNSQYVDRIINGLEGTKSSIFK